MPRYKPLLMTVLICALFMSSASYGYHILVRPQEAIIEPGAGQQFEAQAYSEKNTPVAVAGFEWQVVPEELGTVSEDGYFIAGENPGRGEILATAFIGGERYTGTANITVGAQDEETIKIIVEPETAVVSPFGHISFKAIAVSREGVSLRMRSIRWFVEPGELGNINNKGVFTAGAHIGEGQVTAIVEIDNQIYRGSAAVTVSTPATAAIAGQVKDEAGAGLSESVVTVMRLNRPAWRKSATSDQDGRYQIDNLIAGDYIVWAEHTGYISEYYDGAMYLREATPVRLAEQDTLENIDFELGPGATISGTVTADSSGEPLNGAHVVAVLRVDPRVSFHALTNENGAYSLVGLPSGSYLLHANSAGYVQEFFDNAANPEDATLVEVQAGQETSGINFSLASSSAITGIVTAEDGTPIAEAQVAVAALISTPFGGHHRFIHHTRTDENGEYIIQVRPGIYIVHAEAEGYAGEWYEDASEPLSATAVTVAENEHAVVNFELAPLGSISGLVSDQATGDPVPGALVKAFSEKRQSKMAFRAVTDENGVYAFAGLPEGDYIVVAAAEEYLPEFYQEADSIRNATLVTVENGVDVQDINFTLERGGTLRGIVTAEESGAPIANAIVHLSLENGYSKRSEKTDENGAYEFNGLRNGTYYAVAEARGYLREWYSEATARDEATPIEVTTSSTVEGIDFTLTPIEQSGTGISGVVTDDSTGLPIEGATVAVMPLSFARPRRTVTGADGTFELNLQPGVYIAVCTAQGYVGEFYDNAFRWFNAQPIRVVKDQVTEGIDFGLAPQQEGAYMIAGAVLDASGAALGGALITAEQQGEVMAATVSEDDGLYEIMSLPAGDYKVTASVSGFENGYVGGASQETAADVSVGSGANVYDATITLAKSTTNVEGETSIPLQFNLEQNYPNPFNPVTEIGFSIAQPSNVRLAVYNILGKEVKMLVNGFRKPGVYAVHWDGTDNNGVKLASGIYIYMLESKHNGESQLRTRRMMMLR
jgi:uncharacterized surface anchored protein